jgi:hypothetical protein
LLKQNDDVLRFVSQPAGEFVQSPKGLTRNFSLDFNQIGLLFF